MIVVFFRGKYAFLSNMYECPVTVKMGDNVYTFKCAEAAYQACKCSGNFTDFVDLDGREAKKLSKTLPIQSDWDELKFGFMYAIVKAKFEQNKFLKLRLKAIEGDIVEENTWWDTYWGVCEGVGENNLGKILMDLRDYYNPFYCLVVGSRNFNDYTQMCSVLDCVLQDRKYVFIVTGDARGADELAARYAEERSDRCRLKVFSADWDRYGKSAGYRCSEDMHSYISIPSHCERTVIAFWSTVEQSVGTRHNLRLADEYRNPIQVWDYSSNRFLTQEEIWEYV